jgi:hypothetical protein
MKLTKAKLKQLIKEEIAAVKIDDTGVKPFDTTQLKSRRDIRKALIDKAKEIIFAMGEVDSGDLESWLFHNHDIEPQQTFEDLLHQVVNSRELDRYLSDDGSGILKKDK